MAAMRMRRATTRGGAGLLLLLLLLLLMVVTIRVPTTGMGKGVCIWRSRPRVRVGWPAHSLRRPLDAICIGSYTAITGAAMASLSHTSELLGVTASACQGFRWGIVGAFAGTVSGPRIDKNDHVVEVKSVG